MKKQDKSDKTVSTFDIFYVILSFILGFLETVLGIVFTAFTLQRDIFLWWYSLIILAGVSQLYVTAICAKQLVEEIIVKIRK